MLGIARGRDTAQGVAGCDAVRLWHEYERGSGDVLPLLLKCEEGGDELLRGSSNPTHPEFVGVRFWRRVGRTCDSILLESTLGD